VPGNKRIRVNITTTPPDATVLIDNKRMGRTPFEAVIEPRGDHVWLKVRKRGHATRKVKVAVEPTLTWDVSLPRR